MRKDEEKKEKARKKAQDALKAELFKQSVDKKERAAKDKADRDQQAEMWKTENELWRQEEKRIKDKINKVNQDTKAFLES